MVSLHRFTAKRRHRRGGLRRQGQHVGESNGGGATCAAAGSRMESQNNADVAQSVKKEPPQIITIG